MKLKLLQLAQSAPVDLTDVQPFVFKSTEVDPELNATEGNIAAPFAKFSIEMSGNDYVMYDPDISTSVVLVEELTPDEYLFTLNFINPLKNFYYTVKCTKTEGFMCRNNNLWEREPRASELYAHVYELVKRFTNRIYDEKSGLINCSGKATYKNKSGRKCTYKPRDVIYCSGTSRKSKSEPVGVSGQRTRWMEAWSVRSHWRSISPDSLGLNRAGERVVQGKTFIGEYFKGGDAAKLRPRVITQ